jgi:hypothetical protein
MSDSIGLARLIPYDSEEAVRKREARVRRAARRQGLIFRKARRPFSEAGVLVRYYYEAEDGLLRVVYADPETAESDLIRGEPMRRALQDRWTPAARRIDRRG